MLQQEQWPGLCSWVRPKNSTKVWHERRPTKSGGGEWFQVQSWSLVTCLWSHQKNKQSYCALETEKDPVTGALYQWLAAQLQEKNLNMILLGSMLFLQQFWRALLYSLRISSIGLVDRGFLKECLFGSCPRRGLWNKHFVEENQAKIGFSRFNASDTHSEPTQPSSCTKYKTVDGKTFYQPYVSRVIRHTQTQFFFMTIEWRCLLAGFCYRMTAPIFWARTRFLQNKLFKGNWVF